jgi:hypothetical protein
MIKVFHDKLLVAVKVLKMPADPVQAEDPIQADDPAPSGNLPNTRTM